MDDAFSGVTELDDFQVIAEWRRLTKAVAALTDRYRRIN